MEILMMFLVVLSTILTISSFVLSFENKKFRVVGIIFLLFTLIFVYQFDKIDSVKFNKPTNIEFQNK